VKKIFRRRREGKGVIWAASNCVLVYKVFSANRAFSIPIRVRDVVARWKSGFAL
jgi:hypothetical protein